MNRFTVIDLSGLPPPAVVETLDYEAIVKAMRDDLVARFPAIVGVIDLESEPARKLIEVFAYREMLLRARVNDAARAVMLATAIGADLDHLGALFGVPRLAGETDARFRRRLLLAPDAYSTAGPVGAYAYHALTVSTAIKDVSVSRDRPGKVMVTVMMAGADPAPDAAMIRAIDLALNAEAVRPLTDDVVVIAPKIVPTAVKMRLTLYPGPEAATVVTAATAAVNALIERTSYLGYDLKRSALFAAGHQEGVYGVEVIEPAADILLTPRDVCTVTSVEITVAGRDT
jgi:phage-related baseplate assembly protein